MGKLKKSVVVQTAIKKHEKVNTGNRKKYIFFCVLATFIVFLHSALHNGMTNWDDELYVSGNTLIRSWDFAGLFITRVASNWAPAHMFLLMIEYHLFGLNPVGYHLTSLLLHLCNVALTFLLVYKLTSKQLTAAIAALLFGIHPMHAVSVAWVADQKDLLYYFFYLASMLMYCSYKEHRDIAWYKNKYLFWSMMFFLLSCLSKAMGVTLPIALALIDSYQENNWKWKFMAGNLAGKVPFLIISAGFGVGAWFAQKSGGALQSLGHTPIEQSMFACYGLISYLVNFVAPVSLSAFHSYPLRDAAGNYPLIYLSGPLSIIISTAIIIGIITWRARNHRSNNTLFFGLFFFLLNIILVLQLKPVGHAMWAERYSYLSYLGLLLIAATGFTILWEKYHNHSRKLLLAGYYTLVFAFGLYSFSYANIWKNSIALWTQVIDSFPDGMPMSFAAEAYNNRGDAYIDRNELDLALRDCNKAIALNPYFFLAYNNRAVIYIRWEKPDSVIANCNKAISLKPDFALAYSNRALAYAKQNKPDLVFADCNKAIHLNPHLFQPYNNRAVVYFNQGKFDSTIADCNRAIALNPNFSTAFSNRGNGYANEGKLDLAIRDWTTTLSIDPNNLKAYVSRAHAYLREGDKIQAQADFGKARSLGWTGSK